MYDTRRTVSDHLTSVNRLIVNYTGGPSASQVSLPATSSRSLQTELDTPCNTTCNSGEQVSRPIGATQASRCITFGKQSQFVSAFIAGSSASIAGASACSGQYISTRHAHQAQATYRAAFHELLSCNCTACPTLCHHRLCLAQATAAWFATTLYLVHVSLQILASAAEDPATVWLVTTHRRITVSHQDQAIHLDCNRYRECCRIVLQDLVSTQARTQVDCFQCYCDDTLLRLRQRAHSHE